MKDIYDDALNEVVELGFDIKDFKTFPKIITINNGNNKNKLLKDEKNKIVKRVIKRFKKKLGRNLTNEEINLIKNA